MYTEHYSVYVIHVHRLILDDTFNKVEEAPLFRLSKDAGLTHSPIIISFEWEYIQYDRNRSHNRVIYLKADLPLCSVNMLEPSMRGSLGTRGLLRAERMDAPLAVPRSFACCAPMVLGYGPELQLRRTIPDHRTR